MEERRGAEWAPGVLDPLLKILSREFIDNSDLSVRLQNLFYVSEHQFAEMKIIELFKYQGVTRLRL